MTNEIAAAVPVAALAAADHLLGGRHATEPTL